MLYTNQLQNRRDTVHWLRDCSKKNFIQQVLTHSSQKSHVQHVKVYQLYISKFCGSILIPEKPTGFLIYKTIFPLALNNFE